MSSEEGSEEYDSSEKESSVSEEELVTSDDGETMNETSAALNLFLKLFFNHDDPSKLLILDKISTDIKTQFSLALASALMGESSPSTFIQTANPPEPKKTTKKPPPKKKPTTEKQVTTSNTSETTSKESEKKEKGKKGGGTYFKGKKQYFKKKPEGEKSKKVENYCNYLFTKGKSKGSQCTVAGSEKIGDNFTCLKHKKYFQKQSEKPTTTVVSNLEEQKDQESQKNKKPVIFLTKKIHLCETDQKELCKECLQAKEGDLIAVAYPHKITKTPDDVSGFLKLYVFTEVKVDENLKLVPNVSLVFINYDTGFLVWTDRFNSFTRLKEFIFESHNSVSYSKLKSGRSSAYQLDSISPPDGDQTAQTSAENTKPAAEAKKQASEGGNEKQEFKTDENLLKTINFQRKTIKSMLENKGKEGELAYLLPTPWFSKWKEFVCYSHSSDADLTENDIANGGPTAPGPINNSHLLENENELKKNLKVDFDISAVTESVWNLLKKWFGGGPEIRRPFVFHSPPNSDNQLLIVELYPIQLSIKSSENEYRSHIFSQFSTIRELLSFFQQEKIILPLAADKISHIAVRNKDRSQVISVDDLNQTLSNLGIENNSIIEIECEDKQ